MCNTCTIMKRNKLRFKICKQMENTHTLILVALVGLWVPVIQQVALPLHRAMWKRWMVVFSWGGLRYSVW